MLDFRLQLNYLLLRLRLMQQPRNWEDFEILVGDVIKSTVNFPRIHGLTGAE